MKGPTRLCRRFAAASSPLPMGVEKRRANSFCVPSTSGMRKSKMLHRSERRFSTGVPVSAKRVLATSCLTLRAACVFAFLM